MPSPFGSGKASWCWTDEMVSSFNTQSHNLLLRDFRVDASLRLGNIYFPLWQIDKWHRVLSHLTVCQFWSWSLRWTHSLRSWIKFQVLNMVNETIVWTVMPTAAPPPLSRTRLESFPCLPVSSLHLLWRYDGHQSIIVTDISAMTPTRLGILSSFLSHRRSLCWCSWAY